jgi:hypothetical protein
MRLLCQEHLRYSRNLALDIFGLVGLAGGAARRKWKKRAVEKG